MDTKLFLDELDRAVEYFHGESLIIEGPLGNAIRSSLNSVESAASDARRALVSDGVPVDVTPTATGADTTPEQIEWSSLTAEQRRAFIDSFNRPVLENVTGREGEQTGVEEVKPWQSHG